MWGRSPGSHCLSIHRTTSTPSPVLHKLLSLQPESSWVNGSERGCPLACVPKAPLSGLPCLLHWVPCWMFLTGTGLLHSICKAPFEKGKHWHGYPPTLESSGRFSLGLFRVLEGILLSQLTCNDGSVHRGIAHPQVRLCGQKRRSSSERGRLPITSAHAYTLPTLVSSSGDGIQVDRNGMVQAQTSV